MFVEIIFIVFYHAFLVTDLDHVSASLGHMTARGQGHVIARGQGHVIEDRGQVIADVAGQDHGRILEGVRSRTGLCRTLDPPSDPGG